MNREIRFPSTIVMKRGIDIEGEIERLGYREPFYLTGPYTKKFSPRADGVVRRPWIEEVAEIEPIGDIIVGVGGGKVLDAAKYLSMVHRIPYILVPTLPSSDGIASPAISLFEDGSRVSFIHEPPRAILLDLNILEGAPKKYYTAGFGDVIAKYSSLYDWWLGHKRRGEYFGRFTSSIVKFAVRHLISHRKKLYSPEGLNILLESLVLCGGSIGIQGTSRPASGSEHLISHALDILRLRNGEEPGVHGIQVGLATVFTSYLQGRRWQWIKQILEEVGFPSLGDVADEDLFVEAVLMAPRLRERYTILHERRPTREEVKKIIEEVGI